MREICLDTETTGLDPRDGHRIIEIACVELVNKVRTGRFFHQYINPRRDVPESAFKIHGISTEFLQDKPIFDHVAKEFLDFIQDGILVIHNAAFDIKFLNYELGIVGLPLIEKDLVIDSLALARKKFPGSPASLDALCKRFNIDLSRRTKHGALLDSELLCDIYVELMGGAQIGMSFNNDVSDKKSDIKIDIDRIKRSIPKREFPLSKEDIEAHKEFILKNFKNNFWY